MTEPTATPDSGQQPRRRRVRFSLKTVLLVFTLVSLWFGFVYERVQRERRAVEAIEAAGGEVAYDCQVDWQRSDSNPRPTPPGPTWLRNWLGRHWFDSVVDVRCGSFWLRDKKRPFDVIGPHLRNLSWLKSVSLSLSDAYLLEEEARILASLPRLESLSISYITIGDDAAAILAKSPRVRELRLWETSTSPRALVELARLPNLEEVSATCQWSDRQTGRITNEHRFKDDHLRAIAQCKQLRSLMLFQTEITDEGVQSLGELKNLESLTISSPHVTGKSLEFVSKLPRLEIIGTWQWKLTIDDLKVLPRMKKLKNLDLLTELSDEHLQQIAGLTQLTHFRTRGKRITNDGIKALHGLVNLERLDIDDTSVDKYGPAAAALQKALPKCFIRLPPTEEEIARKRAFRNSKFFGRTGSGTAAGVPISPY